MYKVQNINDNSDSIKIEWNLGKRCNLDCAYCPSEIHDNHSPHTNINLIKKAIDKISTLSKPVRLSFTGGEPSVHPNIEEILNLAANKTKWLNMTTNALRKGSWYHDQPVNHYVFSLHFDNNFQNRALENIIEFSKTNTQKEYFVNVMAHHDYMPQVKNAVQYLEKHDINYAVRRIRWTKEHDDFDDNRYKKQDLDWLIRNDATARPNCLIDNQIEMHANDVIKKNLNQFKNWKCAAGVESLMINWDGEVHRATCRVGGSLGNIYKGDFIEPVEWITCTRRFCTCAADIPLTKVSI
jgi:MoaA/NifB/PqqE/SkfB family radical SAM enzyme